MVIDKQEWISQNYPALENGEAYISQGLASEMEIGVGDIFYARINASKVIFNLKFYVTLSLVACSRLASICKSNYRKNRAFCAHRCEPPIERSHSRIRLCAF